MEDQTSETLYQRLVKAGCDVSSHESDLYVRYTEPAQVIIKE